MPVYDPTFQLPTPRLWISHLDPNNDMHCAFLVELWNTPEFIKGEGGKTGIDTVEKARSFIAGRMRKDHDRNGYGIYLLSLKLSSESKLEESRPIGILSLMRGEEPNCHTVPDIGFAVWPQENGKGYATEGAKALVDYARENLGVDGIFAITDETNVASWRVMQKIGLVDRGEHILRVFGGRKAHIWASEGMNEDLSVYGV